jgi:hypothetical protein
MHRDAPGTRCLRVGSSAYDQTSHFDSRTLWLNRGHQVQVRIKTRDGSYLDWLGWFDDTTVGNVAGGLGW